MNKIRKFRLASRPASVLKNLKALTGQARATPELEQAVETEIRRAADLYATAAAYATFEPGKTPAALASFWEKPVGAPAEPVALTLYVATIGLPLEEELGGALSRGEAFLSQVLTAVGEESADQAAGFVGRLVEEEASREGCELSDRRDAGTPEARREVLALLGGDKLGVAVDAPGRLSPRFTRVGGLLWYPPKKRR
jgi:hypothetical protein